jgi:hypothetical protein
MVLDRLKAIGGPRVYGPLIALAALLSLLLLTKNEFYLNLYFMVFMFAGLSSAWNIIGGFGGQLSLGHSAFYGLGLYLQPFCQMVPSARPDSQHGFPCSGLDYRIPCFRLKGPSLPGHHSHGRSADAFGGLFRRIDRLLRNLSIAFKPPDQSLF